MKTLSSVLGDFIVGALVGASIAYGFNTLARHVDIVALTINHQTEALMSEACEGE